MSTVLVTGGSGYVGSHVLVKLLAAGHTVRTTLRSLSREAEVRAMVREGGQADDRLSFHVADLGQDAGWDEAVAGCEFVMHVASPIPAVQPKDENELIVPARDGVLRVLRAARDGGVKRVVFTSTCGAIYYGHPSQEAPFDETNWTNLDGDDISAYIKSKALAERAAWDFMGREGGALELAVVNPAGIFGPVLGPDVASSVELFVRVLRGIPAAPKIWFGVVDVRDVADLHVLAMTNPAARAERFIATTGRIMSVLEVSKVLRERLPELARKAPRREVPSWVVRLAAPFLPTMSTLLPLLDKKRPATNAKARRVLGWNPRPPEETIVDTALSLAKFGALDGR